jgi:hypothetical protein
MLTRAAVTKVSKPAHSALLQKAKRNKLGLPNLNLGPP